jgi:eukaryotic-like serine/threonine-protein kinase
MVMVSVPAGQFTMGSPDGTGEHGEHLQHLVFLDAFWMDKTVITNTMYAVCVKAGGCTPPQATDSQTRSDYYGNPQYNNYPVINVGWYQAEAYCSWAGQASGANVSLPSEAQWEKAARSPAGFRYPWGEASPTCVLANYAGCTRDTTAVDAHPDGASPYGVLDMAGNVWQWMNDWYSKDYYSESPQNNPQGPATGKDKVLRGSSWGYTTYYLRSAGRQNDTPANARDDVGIRCSRSLP